MLKRVLLTSSLVLFAYLGLVIAIFRGEISEAIQESKCSIANCDPLVEAELRVHVVKNLLRMKLHRDVEMHVGKYRLMLLSKTYTKADLKVAILDASLFEQVKSDALELRTGTQIDTLTAEMLSAYDTIAIFSESHRRLDLIPIGSLRQARTDEVKNFPMRSGQGSREGFSNWEMLRGYGRIFFWITEYKRISLACCDGKGGDGVLSKEWFNANSIVNTEGAHVALLAVSRHGSILARGDEQDFSYIWH